MQTTTCIFDRCAEKIQVDERLGMGMFNVAGFCDYHDRVYARQIKLFIKMFGKDNWVEGMNKLWKENKKKYLKVQKQALKEVKK